jgi:hypothetical protein
MFNPVNKKVHVSSIEEISAELAADLKKLDGRPVNLESIMIFDSISHTPESLQEIRMEARENIYSRHPRDAVSSSQPAVLDEVVSSGGYPQSNMRG